MQSVCAIRRCAMFLALLVAIFGLTSATAAFAETRVNVLYLERQMPPPAVLSNLDPTPSDNGLMGARLGIADNATTGSFLGQTYDLIERIVPVEEDFEPTLAEIGQGEIDLIVAHMPSKDLLLLSEAVGERALILNATARDDGLRGTECRANIMHTAVSRAMVTDALAQFLVTKKWTDVFLIEGTGAGDQAYATAFRNSTLKFGLRLREEKVWEFDADMRRNATAEVPLFTQVRDYDVLVVADEREDFGRYIAYNTWDPRPVAGTEGLVPSAWSTAVEQWGAAQLQSRFTDLAGRGMTSEDYGVWAAVRSIGEAVTRTNSAKADVIRAYLLSDEFQLAGFKGRKMGFRPWNGQLRQPIPLTHPRALVAMAPLDGFLHERTELDTLGQDKPESACSAFD